MWRGLNHPTVGKCEWTSVFTWTVTSRPLNTTWKECKFIFFLSASHMLRPFRPRRCECLPHKHPASREEQKVPCPVPSGQNWGRLHAVRLHVVAEPTGPNDCRRCPGYLMSLICTGRSPVSVLCHSVIRFTKCRHVAVCPASCLHDMIIVLFSARPDSLPASSKAAVSPSPPPQSVQIGSPRLPLSFSPSWLIRVAPICEI